MVSLMIDDPQALDIIRRLMTGGYGSEAEDDEKLGLLERWYHEISDLIFWNRRGLTAEEILAEAKAKKPILL